MNKLITSFKPFTNYIFNTSKCSYITYTKSNINTKNKQFIQEQSQAQTLSQEQTLSPEQILSHEQEHNTRKSQYDFLDIKYNKSEDDYFLYKSLQYAWGLENIDEMFNKIKICKN